MCCSCIVLFCFVFQWQRLTFLCYKMRWTDQQRYNATVDYILADYQKRGSANQPSRHSSVVFVLQDKKVNIWDVSSERLASYRHMPIDVYPSFSLSMYVCLYIQGCVPSFTVESMHRSRRRVDTEKLKWKGVPILWLTQVCQHCYLLTWWLMTKWKALFNHMTVYIFRAE